MQALSVWVLRDFGRLISSAVLFRWPQIAAIFGVLALVGVRGSLLGCWASCWLWLFRRFHASVGLVLDLLPCWGWMCALAAEFVRCASCRSGSACLLGNWAFWCHRVLWTSAVFGVFVGPQCVKFAGFWA